MKTKINELNLESVKDNIEARNWFMFYPEHGIKLIIDNGEDHRYVSDDMNKVKKLRVTKYLNGQLDNFGYVIEVPGQVLEDGLTESGEACKFIKTKTTRLAYFLNDLPIFYSDSLEEFSDMLMKIIDSQRFSGDFNMSFYE